MERRKLMEPAGITPPTKWAGRLAAAYEAIVARLGGLNSATPKPVYEALVGDFPELTLQARGCWVLAGCVVVWMCGWMDAGLVTRLCRRAPGRGTVQARYSLPPDPPASLLPHPSPSL